MSDNISLCLAVQSIEYALYASTYKANSSFFSFFFITQIILIVFLVLK